jgi:TatD DNase family protein
MGFHLGLGGVLTYKNAGVAEAVKDIPMEYLVLETDAPYLAPHPHRGKRNESSYVHFVAQTIAEIRGVDYAEIV